jgi:hypothetical protein
MGDKQLRCCIASWFLAPRWRDCARSRRCAIEGHCDHERDCLFCGVWTTPSPPATN